MTVRKRVGILISGRGSNMAALIEACRAPDYPAEIAVVISNRPDAEGLNIAREAGVSAIAVDHKAYITRGDFEADMHRALINTGVELICNAGFMRLLTADFVEIWRNRQLNIHPSLLPAFRGLKTHERVLEAGVNVTGCTVHFVRFEMDEGPIVAQARVPVLSGDTPETLGARVLAAEHKLYPHALRLIASGDAWVDGEKVHFKETSANAEASAPIMNDVSQQ